MKSVKFLVGEGEPTEVVEAEFEDEEWDTLQRFCDYSEDLFSTSRLAREGIQTSFNVSWEQGSRLKTESKLPDDGEIIILLHKLRRLILQTEPTSFQNIRKLVSRKISSETVRMQLNLIKKKFFGRELQSLFVVYSSAAEHEGFHLLNSEETLQSWLNGFEYHGDVDKRAHIESLHRMIPLDDSKVFFLMMLSAKIDAIRILLRILDVLQGREKRIQLNRPLEEPLRHRIFLLPFIKLAQFFEDMPQNSIPVGIEDVQFTLQETREVKDFQKSIWFLWNQWIDSVIPFGIGSKGVYLKVPDGFLDPGEARPTKDGLLIFQIAVCAVVTTAQGEIKFTPSKDSAGGIQMTPDTSSVRHKNSVCIESRHQFTEFLEEIEKTGAVLESILKVPRFVFLSSFWPISSKAFETISRMRQEGKEPSFQEVEGSDIAAAWEIFAELGMDPSKFSRKLSIKPEDLV